MRTIFYVTDIMVKIAGQRTQTLSVVINVATVVNFVKMVTLQVFVIAVYCL